MISIILATCVFVSANLKLVLILGLIGIFLIFLITFALFRKRILLVISVCLLAAIIPLGSIYFKTMKLEKNKSLTNKEFSYTGTIYKISQNLDNNVITFYLNDVEIVYNDLETKKFYGDIYVRLYADGVDTSKLSIGSKIRARDLDFKCLTLSKSSTEYDKRNISNGVSATSYLFSYNYVVEERGELNLRENIKARVYGLFDGTNYLFTNIGYAMIFGESSILDNDVYEVFKNSGIAHLLAVSGFHISVIVAFLNFILNKLKANKYLRLSIIGILLLGYAYLCSFSVSVIRASIMALLLIYSINRNKEYDRLSALSLAAIFLLTLNPMQLFNLSFILSFMSVLSIILLMPLFERVFSKFLNEKVSSSLSISLAVCIGTMVFQLYYFRTFPVISVISNLVTIPAVGVLFIFLIISVLICGLFPFATPLINVFGGGMKYIININNWLSGGGLHFSAGNLSAVALILSIVIMFVVSDYVFLNKKIKWPLAVAGLIGLTLLII